MVRDCARVFAEQVRLDLFNRRLNRQRTPFEERLAEARDARIGVNFEEEPARLDEESFQLRDLDTLSGNRAFGGSRARCLNCRRGALTRQIRGRQPD